MTATGSGDGESSRRTPAFSRRCSWRSSTLGGARAARCRSRPQPRAAGSWGSVCADADAAGWAGSSSAVDGDAEVLVASTPGPKSASASRGCHGWFGPAGGDRETAAYFAGLSAGLDVPALPQLGGDLPIRLVADSATTGPRRRLLWGLAVHGRELEIDRPRRALIPCTCRQLVRTICPASRAKGGK